MFAYRKKKRSTIFAISAKPCRKKIVINWRAYFLGALIISALIGFLYLLIFSSVLKIKKWSVESSNFTSTAQAQETVNRFFNEKIWKIFPQNNWLVFFGRDLSDQLLLAYPEAKNVSISKDIIKGIKIIITGRSPAAIWCDSLAIPVSESIDATSTQAVVALPQSEKCFFTDDEGLLYHEAPEIFGTGLPTFFDSYQQGLLPGNQAIASPTILFASQLKKQLREIGIDLPGFMTGASDSTDLFAFTDESWVVYFNMARPLQSQVKVLGALLNGEIKDKRVGLKYIDLRLAGKVYYK
ncbi:MAG: hypothetical protein A3B04_00260 [Candidatus Portnoybacteria bacterium RIFCSPLOWO2_02_FULL_39_11]|uniref:POTRA domain-containing protein n=1 Tax=Candidatus Portnoybacteria bacterium RIFCSPLOWO2_02_FULL_39_11 TaxID=1802001 RepID=A0A1G2FPT2_9BACT|nr:MAG: hypothetical protein A3B04_00260 [Candidatus Portnoybacteria bacterium RIFCSPLOWO2_02_FULL_39_11]